MSVAVSTAHRLASSVPRRSLPVFDVGAVRSGALSAARDMAPEWAHVCETLGFMCVVNHGVPDALIRRMEQAARDYHALPAEVKLAWPFTMRDQKGYAPARFVVRGATKFNVERMVDTVEAVVLATDYAPDDPRVRAGKRFFVPTVWPPAELVPDFRPAAEAYMAAINALGKALLPVWSLALGLDASFFTPHFEDNYVYFRIARYPSQPDLQDNEMGVNAHADTGFMTFLPPAQEEGLQIQAPDGTWFWPDLPPGALIINTGQFLERWTNDRFRATPHRVVPPVKNDRYSLACFVSPNFDAPSACLPTCTDPGNPPRYPTMTYWEFFDWYQNTGFAHNRVPDECRG